MTWHEQRPTLRRLYSTAMRSFVVLLVAVLFLIVITTGLMAFLLPFDIDVTRVHATTAPILTLFVLWHVIHNRRSLKRYVSRKHWLQLSAMIVTVGVVAGLFYFNAPPIEAWMNQSYEQRRADIVFRPSQDVTVRHIDRRIEINRTDEQVTIDIRVESTATADVDGRYIAIWIENDEGKMLETLFLSESLMFEDSTGSLGGGPATRKGLLPVWWHRWETRRAELQTSNAPREGVDAVSQPTPRMDFKLATLVNMQQPRFNVMLEVSRDRAPSQVYTALVDLDRLKKHYLLDFLALGTAEGKLGYDTGDISIESLAIEKALVSIADKRSKTP